MRRRRNRRGGRTRNLSSVFVDTKDAASHGMEPNGVMRLRECKDGENGEILMSGFVVERIRKNDNGVVGTNPFPEIQFALTCTLFNSALETTTQSHVTTQSRIRSLWQRWGTRPGRPSK